MDKPLRALRGLFSVCFIIAAASILMLSGYALALLFAAGVFLLLRKKPIPRFTVWLFIGGLLLRLAFVLVLHPPLESDFQMLYEAAQSLNAGDLSFLDTVYFSLWAYQSVFVAWEAMFLSIWNNPLCLELVNAVLSAAIVCLTYRIAREHVRESSAQAAAILLTAFPFALSLHTVLSNQIPSAFFLLLGLWLLACKDCARLGFWRFPLAGLALQLGNLLRSEGLILLVAVLAFAVFEAFAHPEAIKRLALGILTLLVVYFGTNAAAGAVVRATGLNPYGVQNGNPGWKFVTGLNFNTSGGYSQDDWALIYPTLDENHQITPATEQVQNGLIRERLSSSPDKLARHIVNKIRFLWCSDSLGWAFGHTQKDPTWSRETVYTVMQQFDRGLFFLAVGLGAFGLWGKKRWQKRPMTAYLPYFAVFAAFCALLLIEVQPRYAYLPQLFIFLTAAFGIDRLPRKEEQHG